MSKNLLDYVGLGYFLEKIKTLFVTELGTSGDNLTWTKNSETTNIAIPYATEASKIRVLLTKTYENVLRNGTGYTSPYTNSYLYFGSVKTTNLALPSHVKYRMLAYAPSNANFLLESIVEWYFGNNGIYKGYYIWNNLSSTSYYPFYCHTLYSAKTAAIATSDGSYLGCYYGTSTSYGQSPNTVARTIKIEILECNNCTVNLLDNVVWLMNVNNVPANLKLPSTSKAYNDTNFTANNVVTSVGLQETGDANTNTVGYLLRTNSYSKPMKAALGYGYRLLFTSADLLGWVPANTSTSSNATAVRTPCTEPIDPFGEIVYYSGSGAIAVDARPGATSLWLQYAITFGYSFNTTGAALTFTSWKPVYIKCTPLANGSAVIEGYTQDLPTTEDGFIYIYLGVAYNATSVELVFNHPVYYYKNGAVRLFTSQLNPDWDEISNKPSTFTPASHDHNDLYVTSVGVSDDNTNHPNLLKYVKNNTSTYFTVPFATTASKIGSTTVGSSALPVYINNGTPNVISKIPGNLIQGSGINSLINTNAAVGINPAINAAGMNLAKGGNVRVFVDNFELIHTSGYLDILFDGLNSTYYVPLNPSSLSSEHNYSSSKTYNIGDFTAYNNTSNKRRWYRSKVDNNLGNMPSHELDNNYWEYVSGTGGYEIGINPQKINSITFLITLALAASYESGVSIYWRTSGQHPRYLTILKYSDASFTNLVGTPCTRLDMQGEVISTVYCGLSASAYGTYYKITLEGFSGQNYWVCALTQIAFTGLCGGIEGTVVMRKGGNYASMFGDFYPYKNKGAHLGTASYNWNNVYAAKFITSGGTSSQFVKGDGSLDSTSYGTYSKPSGGIPKTDLASAVQTSLGKADTALLNHLDISGKENSTNKVTSLSSSSTDTQYPSAKCVYDLLKDNCNFVEGLDIYEDVDIINNNYYFIENDLEFNDF